MDWTFVILILGHWIVADVIAITALILSFTRFRHARAVLVSALLAVAYGVYLSVSMGLPSKGLPPIYPMSWAPLLLGGITLFRWTTRALPEGES